MLSIFKRLKRLRGRNHQAGTSHKPVEQNRSQGPDPAADIYNAIGQKLWSIMPPEADEIYFRSKIYDDMEMRGASWRNRDGSNGHFDREEGEGNALYVLGEIEAGYAHYAALAGYSSVKFPLKLKPQDSGIRHLELSDDGKMAIVGTDRGMETTRRETYDVEQLLYWLFRDDAMAAGWRYAADHKKPDSDEDTRCVAFSKALEVIGKLSQEWRQRLSDEQQAILRDHPFMKIPQVALDTMVELKREKEERAARIGENH